jgi:phage tail-like protein
MPVAVRPFTAFNFCVEIVVDGDAPLCGGAFSECDGLEASQEFKTIREGGNNGVQVRLAGPTSYGTVTLKRGLTDDGFAIWQWFERSQQDPALRAHADVVLLASDGVAERMRFVLTGCRPMKVKAPPLNAKDGMVAIEELQVAYESLVWQAGPGDSDA